MHTKKHIENTDIYFIKNKKFKTIKIQVLLINELNFNNFTKERLLTNYLGRSINSAKDELTLSKKYLSLYDPTVRGIDVYSTKHIKCLTLNMLNEKYTEKGMNEKTIDFMFEFIFNPNINNNELDQDNFELSKKALDIFYKSKKEDTSDIALNNAFSLIDEEIPIKYDITGNIDDLKNITSKDILDLYYDELKNSEFKIFVTGDVDEEEITNIIKKNIKGKINKNDYELSDYILTKKVKKVIEKVDNDDYNQSKLVYIYKALNLTKREREYTSKIFSIILGGPTSKLYLNVREKNHFVM